MNYEKAYNLRLWTLKKVVNKIIGLKERLTRTDKKTKEWYIIQFKREVLQIKKHIIFMDQMIERYEKEK